jgi:hypothetical protein
VGVRALGGKRKMEEIAKKLYKVLALIREMKHQ